MRRFRKKLSLSKKIIIVIFILIMAFLLLLENQMGPLFEKYSEHNAQVMATDAINEAVQEEMEYYNFTYDDLVTVCYSEDGKMQGITTNVININKLKSAVTTTAQQKIETVQDKDVIVPLGDLMGVNLLKGLGPPVRLNIGLTGSILTDFNSEFTSAGVNQTIHTINIEITADLYLTSAPDDKSELKIYTSMPVAETVLMGTAPNLLGSTSSLYLEK